MEEAPENTLIPLRLLSIPEEILYAYIFPNLELSDLLRLRRVCATIKDFSDAFIRINFKSQEREINETDATFRDFLQRHLPTSKIYLNNSGPGFYQDQDVPEFLRLYGDIITHLRVRHFATCISPAEFQFFSGITNLEYLELEFTDATSRRCNYTSRRVNDIMVPRERTEFPANFANLKTLKLNEIRGSEVMDYGYAWDFVEFCTKLEHIKHPLYHDMNDGASSGQYDGPFGCVTELIKRRLTDFPDQPNLKYYDLEHHEEMGFSICQFATLVNLCYKQNVKLLNVHGQLMENMWALFSDTPEKFTVPLVSLQNVHGNLFLDELPNLEKLVVKSTAHCCFGEAWVDENRPEPEWPQLNILDITIDSEDMRPALEFEENPTQDLLNFLFVGKERAGLKDLSIRFGERRYIGDDVPIPRVLKITESCGNVTKLTLTNWIGTNKAVSMFWEGLPLLEEVTLEECRMLGDVAFVGKRRDDPVFLKLQNLKKLSLKGLNAMPKITDLIFGLVFRHLKIKQFHLHSYMPLKSITLAGIQSLLSGNFNSCVEKFPFEDWSLDRVSEKAFSHLKSQFRATYML